MSKASKSIALFLVPLSLIFLGFHSCDDDNGTSYGSSSGHSYFYGHSGYYGGSGRSSGSSFSSGTSRGGFGSHGGSIGS